MSTPAELDELEREEQIPDVDEPGGGDVDEPGYGDVDELEGHADNNGQADDDPDAGDEAARRAGNVARDEAELASAELMEKRGKQLDKLGVYIGKKLVEIFGEEAADELELCELCQWTHTYGWRVPSLPPEPVREAVKLAIGLGTVAELEPYVAFQACATCKGKGNVRTGSEVGNHMVRPCPSCQGRGYTSTLDADANLEPARVPVAAMAVEEGAPAQLPDRDTFGTPLGDPDYGKMPQFRERPISTWTEFVAPGA